MDNKIGLDVDAFLRMARRFPVRTGIFTFALPLFALFQLVNGLVHGGSLEFIALFAVLTVACSVLLAQYQVAVFRRRRLTRERV
ncbi:hypothetical protein HALDL1_07720 [Halobacterium sp. DL1]|jgi:predicted permease|nr:hypothetical protein HALDL1_07720 [Halobacterium sp. DL1]